MKKVRFFVGMISLLLVISGCTEQNNRAISNNSTASIKTDDEIDALFAIESPSGNLLKTRCISCIEAIEKISLNNVIDEDKLSEIAKKCHLFSNLLVNISKKMLAEKQSEFGKSLLLQLSYRIVSFTKKVRNIISKSNKLNADTLWLSVSYNDKYLNILDRINTITFLEDDNVSNIMEYELFDIATMLNEAIDWNIYQNTVSEIEYDNPKLIAKFYEQLQKHGIFNRDKILDNSAVRKFLKHIEEFVQKTSDTK
jgi:outer membrane lipoprotein-sorting protein